MNKYICQHTACYLYVLFHQIHLLQKIMIDGVVVDDDVIVFISYRNGIQQTDV